MLLYCCWYFSTHGHVCNEPYFTVRYPTIIRSFWFLRLHLLPERMENSLCHFCHPKTRSIVPRLAAFLAITIRLLLWGNHCRSSFHHPRPLTPINGKYTMNVDCFCKTWSNFYSNLIPYTPLVKYSPLKFVKHSFYC